MMIPISPILTECYVDTNLIETIVPSKKGYNHQKGCGTVARKMKLKFADRFVVGIIDKDKNAIKYLNEFDLVVDSGSSVLYKHKTKHHYIIQIAPAVETWLLNCAKASNISMADYGLPDTLKELTKQSKVVTSKFDERFKKLFICLKKANNPCLLKLESWITYLKTNTHDSDIESIKKL